MTFDIGLLIEKHTILVACALIVVFNVNIRLPQQAIERVADQPMPYCERVILFGAKEFYHNESIAFVERTFR